MLAAGIGVCLPAPEISLPNGAYRAIDLIKSERLVR